MRLIDFFILPFFVDTSVSCALLLSNYYAQDIGATKFQVGLKDFAWGMTYMIACLIVGRLSDKLPRRATLVTGIALQGFSATAIQWCQTPAALIAVMPFNALGCSLFWPVFMTLLHDKDAAETNRRIGWFNLGWTSGLSIGMAVSGTLASWNIHAGFKMIGTAAALNLIYLLFHTSQRAKTVWQLDKLEGGNHPTTQPPNHPTSHRAYLYLSWVCCFTLFFSSAAVSNQFPVLARLLHISDRMSSLLLSLTIAGVGVGSVLMSRTTRWHDRIAPLLGAMLVTVGALALLSVATSPLAFGIGLLTTGLARAVVYSASLYYGLRSHLPKGTATSIHETLIGAAFTFGPLIAGGMAQAFNPRAPFAFCLVTVLGVIVMTVVAWQRRRKTA